MAIGRARAVDPPAGALMYSHGFLNVSEIIASNWSLKSRMLQAEVFFWAGWKAPNYWKSREESVKHEIETSQWGNTTLGNAW